MIDNTFKSIEQLENGTALDKIIVLKSVYKQGKTTVQPVADGMGWYKGIQRLSEEDKRKLVHWAEPHNKFIIKEGTTFDLNDEAQRITWEWVKHSPCICATKDEVQHTPGAEFYIHLENEEAKNNISRLELKHKATEYILKDNAVNYPMRAELLGINMDGDSPLVIKEYLMEQADKYPEKILAVYSSKDISVKLLLLKAIKKNVIKIGIDGLYTYGSNVLGTSERSAVNWLSDENNAELVKVLEREVDPEYFRKVKDNIANAPTIDVTDQTGTKKRTEPATRS
jgi:hypothetical protein